MTFGVTNDLAQFRSVFMPLVAAGKSFGATITSNGGTEAKYIDDHGHVVPTVDG